MALLTTKEDIQEAVKNATSEILSGPDYAANATVCESMQASAAVAAAGMETLLKRLGDKNPEVQILAIALIDYLVKNHPKLHPLVAREETLKVLAKIGRGEVKRSLLQRLKSDDDSESLKKDAQEKALVLIETWAKAFQNSRSFPIFQEVYRKMRADGVQFPVPLKDELAPVFTPVAAPPKKKAPPPPRQLGRFSDAECQNASENAALLHDLLTNSSPSEDLKRNDLAVMMAGRLQATQQRVRTRIQSVPPPNEIVMSELFQVNDQIADTLRYYQGLIAGDMERYRAPDSAPPAVAAVASPAKAVARGESERKGASSGSGEKKASATEAKGSEPRRVERTPSVAALEAPPDLVPGAPSKRESRTRKKSDAGAEPGRSPAKATGKEVDLLSLDVLASVLDGPPAAAPASAPAPAPKAEAKAKRKEEAPAKNGGDEFDDLFDELARRNSAPSASPRKSDAPAAAQPSPQAKPPAAAAAADEMDEFDLLARRK